MLDLLSLSVLDLCVSSNSWFSATLLFQGLTPRSLGPRGLREMLNQD